MNRHTSRFTNCKETRHNTLRIFCRWVQNFTMIIGRNAAHIIMHRRQNRNWLLGHVYTSKDFRTLRDARQTLSQYGGVNVIKVQINMIFIWTNTAPFADFNCHCAGHNIARRKIFCRWRITFHEALTFRVDQNTTLTA